MANFVEMGGLKINEELYHLVTKNCIILSEMKSRLVPV